MSEFTDLTMGMDKGMAPERIPILTISSSDNCEVEVDYRRSKYHWRPGKGRCCGCGAVFGE